MEMNRLRILVIDEISMVDPDLLVEVESQLCERALNGRAWTGCLPKRGWS